MSRFLSRSARRARAIFADGGKDTKVVILGTHGMGNRLLCLPHEKRPFRLVAIVDDFRASSSPEYFGVPLLSSEALREMASATPGIIAVNTCERAAPRKYFQQLCRSAGVACIDYAQALEVFSLDHALVGERARKSRGRYFHRLVSVMDQIIATFPWPSAQSGKVALIKLDGTGDFMIWLHGVPSIRQHYAESRIVLFAYAAWADYAATLPWWDEVIAVDHYRFSSELLYRWAIQWRMRLAGYSVAINAMLPRFVYGDDLIRSSRAAVRIGCADESLEMTSEQKRQGDAWYTYLVSTRLEPYAHQMFQHAVFCSPFGRTLHAASLPRTYGVALPQRDYCILFPGAGWRYKRWPAEHFAALGQALQQRFGWTVVLCGGEEEKALCATVASALGPDVVDLGGRTTLAELIEWVRGARVLVSNDTSAIHIAPAVETASVCILGGGHYGAFLPYPERFPGRRPLIAMKQMECFQCNWHCRHERLEGDAFPCVANVSVADVFSLVVQASEDDRIYEGDSMNASGR
ncbi:hypothetical protein HW090_04415 [Pseudomonas sp. ABC1]|uniref:glycosyltransferase family 9 protein n=1 Tax=Pseudomonas sp. ABC1 TaxID=2748080 RepID=UPI0015C39D33|nr:glycosyltransferase family 9 protein [Pseudomonas sp. ABC1]QLF92476.1 hypothetical protein HW090_04415 [Pseudomonas sp. ABC1]